MEANEPVTSVDYIPVSKGQQAKADYGKEAEL